MDTYVQYRSLTHLFCVQYVQHICAVETTSPTPPTFHHRYLSAVIMYEADRLLMRCACRCATLHHTHHVLHRCRSRQAGAAGCSDTDTAPGRVSALRRHARGRRRTAGLDGREGCWLETWWAPRRLALAAALHCCVGAAFFPLDLELVFLHRYG